MLQLNLKLVRSFLLVEYAIGSDERSGKKTMPICQAVE